MDYFGYIAPTLRPGTFWKWRDWLPEAWRYRRGPVFAGKLDGQLGEYFLEGWGWQIPFFYSRVWDETQHARIWEGMRDQLSERRIKVIGVDNSEGIIPRFECGFPGVSDGKTLELLMFMDSFVMMLQQNGLTRNSEVQIVWEEGNLGLACARLIAREIRFLTLVHPRLSTLEQSAAVIMAETGVSPRVTDRLLPDFRRRQLVILCGRLSRFTPVFEPAMVTLVQLFRNESTLARPLPFSITGGAGRLPGSPALAEALLRTAGGVNTGYWSGPTVFLERVGQLAGLLKELRITMTMGNWQS